jgi:hypothetical protein
MSLKQKAAQVRKAGNKRGDSVLAHITPEEAMLLKLRGGAGVPDSKTGALHFYDVGDSEAPGASDNASGDTGGYGGGLDGAPDVGTIGGEGYGTPADGTGVNSMGGYNDSGVGGGYSGFSSYGDDLGSMFGADGSYNDRSTSPTAVEDVTPSWMDFAERKAKSLASSFGVQALSKATGLPGSMLGLGLGLASAKSPAAQAQSFGQTALGTIGGLFGGPVGAMAGSAIGSKVGEAIGAREASRTDADRADAVGSTNATGLGGLDLGSLLTGGLGLYQGYQASQDSRNAANIASQQTQSLANMYGPDSPYAQQLRQQLSRQDARAGRRSQYGPREVELQAKLAEMATRNAPNVLAANRQALEQKQLGRKTNGQMIATGLDLANKSGLTGYAQRGLGSLFAGSNSGNGNSGFTDSGATYNNPSAYSASSSSSGSGNFWDDWF